MSFHGKPELSEAKVTFTCEAILFDMDGTLVNSNAVVERQWRRWAAAHHLDADQILAVAHGRRTIETMRQVAPHLNLAEEEAARFDEEEGRDTNGIVPVAGAGRVLGSLTRDKWAVVTSAGLHLAQNRLGFAGLPLPSVLVSADDVREGKPNPEGYLLAARRMDVRNDRCLVIEDTPAGIEAGMAAGMQVLSIGNTVAREALKGAPWILDFTRLRIYNGDRIEIVVC
jgi:sugar-phosphatase